jgi:hypothetical protein
VQTYAKANLGGLSPTIGRWYNYSNVNLIPVSNWAHKTRLAFRFELTGNTNVTKISFRDIRFELVSANYGTHPRARVRVLIMLIATRLLQ